MSSDHAGHLGYSRLDPEPPGARPGAGGRRARAGLRGRRPRVRRADRGGGKAFGKRNRPRIVLSDHGMKPIYWTFHANRWLEEAGHLRYRRRSLQPLKGGRARRRSRRPTSASRGRRAPYGRALDLVPFLPRPRPRPCVRRHRLRLDPRLLLRHRRPDLPRRGERSACATPASPSGSPANWPRSATRRPASRPSTSAARRSSTTARYLDKAPEIVILPRDERIHVDSSRRAVDGRLRAPRQPRSGALLRLLGPPRPDRDPRRGRAPGSGPADVPAGQRDHAASGHAPPPARSRLRTASTGAPIEAILDRRRRARSTVTSPLETTAAPRSAYSDAEEEDMIERLRDLGYE